MHYLTPYKCLFWYFWSTAGTMWDLCLAISQHLQHQWTSNHLHSLPLMQLHTFAFSYCLLGNALFDAIQMLVLVLLVHCWNHVGSMLGHISTFTAPMDVQPSSFASSDAASHVCILILPSRQCTI